MTPRTSIPLLLAGGLLGLVVLPTGVTAYDLPLLPAYSQTDELPLPPLPGTVPGHDPVYGSSGYEESPYERNQSYETERALTPYGGPGSPTPLDEGEIVAGRDEFLLPPEPIPQLIPVPLPSGEIRTISLFREVRYRRERKIAPDAVPMIVEVPDPCADPCHPAHCQQFVAVKICVPQGCEPCIKISRGGDRIRYDFGKYAVTVTSARGKVLVDYHR